MSWRYEPAEVVEARMQAYLPRWLDNGKTESAAILAYSDLRQRTGSYFRLNIWGMQEYRQAMEVRGMIDWDVHQPPFPERSAYGVSDQDYEAYS
jgi:hypothetical protein